MPKGTVKQARPTGRRFFRQAVQRVGRFFGPSRHYTRAVTQAGTTSATPLALTAGATLHNITTDNQATPRAAVLGVSGYLEGQRKKIVLVSRPGASDSFTLDASSLRYFYGSQASLVTSLTFNVAGQYALLEFHAGKWTILKTSAVLVA